MELWVQLLTPVQVARLMVQAYPHTPDTLSLAAWIAAEDGDATAIALVTGTAPLTLADEPGPSHSGHAASPLMPPQGAAFVAGILLQDAG